MHSRKAETPPVESALTSDSSRPWGLRRQLHPEITAAAGPQANLSDVTPILGSQTWFNQTPGRPERLPFVLSSLQAKAGFPDLQPTPLRTVTHCPHCSPWRTHTWGGRQWERGRRSGGRVQSTEWGGLTYRYCVVVVTCHINTIIITIRRRTWGCSCCSIRANEGSVLNAASAPMFYGPPPA